VNKKAVDVIIAATPISIFYTVDKTKHIPLSLLVFLCVVLSIADPDESLCFVCVLHDLMYKCL